MTEKQYEIPLPHHCPRDAAYIGDARLTLEQITKLKADCERALAKAEAEKPTAWDFGLTRESSPALALKSRQVKNYYQGWVGGREGRDPWSSSPSAIEHGVHILGNLKEIVEKQGPIVVGMSVAYGMALCEHFKGASSWAELMGNVRDALARYERETP